MRRLLPVLLVAALAALPGCSRAPDFVTDRDAVLRLSLTEYGIEPQNLRVRAGLIRIVATNDGRLTHNLAVESIEDEPGAEATSYARTDTSQPGEVVRTSVTLGPGKYRLRCTIGNHDDLGQYGELQVRQDTGG